MQAGIPNILGGSQHIANFYPEPPNVGYVTPMGKKQSGYSGENYLNCLPLSTGWKHCGEFKAEDRGEFVDEPRSKSGMRKRCLPYPVQLERGECSKLLRKVTSQTGKVGKVVESTFVG